MTYTLTIRYGPRVERESFEDLDTAIAAMRERARAIHAEGGLAPAQGFKEYDPGDLVKARLQLSTGGWLRGREAGVDVMGDGALVPYAGAYGRHRLDPASGDDAFDTVRSALT